MSSDDIAIRILDVSKHYFLYARSGDRLKQSLVPRLQRLAGRPLAKYYRDFAALNGISFDVRRGETVGIIGRNGSGKSTLLQIICGTLPPTSGTVEIKGRIAALLELGAGFNPDFTGRENIFMNAAILGLSRSETEGRFDDIAGFADIGEFIEQPVKSYSSGMVVRLAFAVAVSVDPDILVVDEALAVGDEAFQRKCFTRIEEIQDKGGTILFVSHGAQTIVQLCNRAMIIDRGELILQGRPKMVVSQYQRLVNLRHDEAEPVRAEIKETYGSERNAADPHATVIHVETAFSRQQTLARETQATDTQGEFDPNLVSNSMIEYESHGAKIANVRLLTSDGRRVNVLKLGKSYVIEYEVAFSKIAEQVVFGTQIKTLSGLILAGANTASVASARLKCGSPDEIYNVHFDFVCRVMPGTYLIDVGLMGTQDGQQRYLHRMLDVLMLRVTAEDELFDVGHLSLSSKFRLTTKEKEAAFA